MGDTSFGTWLKQRRHDLDLTQTALGQQVGCSVSLLQKLESGHRRPSKQLAELLTAQLGLAPAQRDALTREARARTGLAHRLPPAPGLVLFLARERELAAIGALLAREDCRLITLIGPGGIGKTSLALQAARHTHAFAHGVCLVPLAAVTTPGRLTAALGVALDVTFHDQAEPAAQLHDYLREKQLLLVLDNCEHLLGRLVEGMPLAVELAAGWVSLFAPQTIAEELRRDIDLLAGVSHDRPERHHSLVAVFDQSWRLLADDEQRVLRQLAVFQGGFSGGAAARVSGATLPILRRLVDASLLQSDGVSSYTLHKLVQQGAAKRLRAHPEEHSQSGDAHCDYYTELFSDQIDRPQEAERPGWAALIEMIEHVRAAWAWAVVRGRLDQVERLVDGLCAFLARCGLYREGAEMLGEAALAAQTVGRRPLLVRLQVRHAECLYRPGQVEEARVLLRQSRGDLHRDGTLHDRSRALLLAATMAAARSCSTTAARGYQVSLALAQRAGARAIAASALVGSAGMLRRRGVYPQALQTAEHGLRLALAAGDHVVADDALNILSAIAIECGDVAGAREAIAQALAVMSWAQYELGHYVEAHRLVNRALAIFSAVEDHIGCVLALYSLGRTSLALDDRAAAWAVLVDALRRAQITGATPFVPLILTTVAALLARAGAVERALVILSLVIEHPASIPMAHEEAAPLRAALVAASTPTVVAAAVEQSKGASIEGLADAVLRDFSAVNHHHQG